MNMSKTRSMTVLFAFFGLAVPSFILAAKQLSTVGFDPLWIYFVWPTFFILGGLAGKVDAAVIAFFALAIVLNVVIYAYVGSVVGRLLFSSRESQQTARTSEER